MQGNVMSDVQHPSRLKLLEAAIGVIRAKGYTATTVDDICAASGVSKGSFFHHFKSKEDLVLAAVDHWNRFTGSIFESAPYQALPDPRDRLLAYVDFRTDILDREVQEFTCLLGTLVQETYATHPALREACDLGMTGHIEVLMRDIEAAKALYAPDATWTVASVGYFMQSVLQGAFIYAKVKQGPDIARDSLRHLRAYLDHLFSKPVSKEE